MCEEEKRRLIIPSDMGYGDRGAPPKIPGEVLCVLFVLSSDPPENCHLTVKNGQKFSFLSKLHKLCVLTCVYYMIYT